MEPGQGKEPKVTVTGTAEGGWIIRCDNDAWVNIMLALMIAANSEEKIGRANTNAADFRRLRTALSQVTDVERRAPDEGGRT